MRPLIATELAFHALGVLEVHLTLWLLGEQPRLADSFIFETVNRLTTVLFKFVPQQPGLNEGATVLAAQVLGFSFETGSTLGMVRAGPACCSGSSRAWPCCSAIGSPLAAFWRTRN